MGDAVVDGKDCKPLESDSSARVSTNRRVIWGMNISSVHAPSGFFSPFS